MFQEALTEEGKKLFPLLKNFNDFYLAGGTALALQIGHRVSVDFDFFSEKEILPSLLKEKVDKEEIKSFFEKKIKSIKF
ncbi:MAG: nucleotidyl transferase AbiEii/AbiGii toxin family protein [bacterium]